MQIVGELIRARVAKVYNSLIIDVKLPDNTIVPVFCAATEVIPLCTKNTEVYLTASESPLRKIKYQLQFINRPEGLIFANPAYTNRIFSEAIENHLISELADYTQYREIEPDDHLRHVDFELTNANGEKCFVFLKNLYFKQDGCTIFPESMNFFEYEMFEELSQLRALGHQTMVVMMVPRMDCMEAHFTWKYDPVASAKLFDEAKNGLTFVCYGCNIEKNVVTLAHSVKIVY